MAQPTFVLQVGNQYFALKSDMSSWCTTVTNPGNDPPDWTQATPVQITDEGGAAVFVSVRNALRNGAQIAQTNGITPVVFIDS
jgi:hypothetical protein